MSKFKGFFKSFPVRKTISMLLAFAGVWYASKVYYDGDLPSSIGFSSIESVLWLLLVGAAGAFVVWAVFAEMWFVTLPALVLTGVAVAWGTKVFDNISMDDVWFSLAVIGGLMLAWVLIIKDWSVRSFNVRNQQGSSRVSRRVPPPEHVEEELEEQGAEPVPVGS